MKRKIVLFVFLFLWIVNITSLVAQLQVQPLPIDPAIRYGKLENGLTYYIRHNAQTKERADFYIAQNVGSVLEEDNQRGLAHLLEHMAFEGSENFPGEGMEEFTQRIGIMLGDLNAYTSFDETVYMIKNVPVTSQEVIDSCLLILHDWSGFLTLDEPAIEKERAIVREEWRTGQDAQSRIWEQQLPALYPGNRYGERLPIGTIDVINNFTPDELQDYYKKWYRPDLQAVIIVGDIDADRTEQQVKALFSDIPAPVDPAERVWFEVDDNETPLVAIATDKESTNIILYLIYKHDKMPKELYATITGPFMDYFKSITTAMLNARLSELLQTANPPFLFATTWDGDYMVSKTKGGWTAVAIVEEGKLDTSMAGLVMEIERAKQYGFTEAEYERARINLLKRYETGYNERENQENSVYVQEYVDHFTNGGYIPGIETEYAIMNEIAPAITIEEINEYFQQLFDDNNIAISLVGPEKEGLIYPSAKELLAMYNQAKELPVEPYTEEISDEPLVPVLPQPGKIISTTTDPLFDATVMELSNGIKVILKPTEFKRDEVLVTATSPGGSTLFGNEDNSNLKIFNDVITLGGLGNFSATDLRKVLAGKKASVSVSLGLDTENVNGSAAPADLETLFQLIYLNFTAKRMDTEAYESYINRVRPQLLNKELDPMVAFSDTITKTLYDNNPRAGQLETEDLDRASYPRIMEMYRERYADASDFIFTFVGNIDIETITPYIELYLASLPSLGRVEKGNPSVVPAYHKGKAVNHFRRTMETPKASVFKIYTGTMDLTLENSITASLLSQILNLVYMEKIRKEEGGSYGVYAGVSISQFPAGRTSLQINFDTDPEKRERMSEIIKEELERIAGEGPDPDDFEKAKEGLLKRYGENIQENSYWLRAIDNYYFRNFDAYSSYVQTLQNITPAKIREFMKQLLDQGNNIEVVMQNQ